MTVPAGVPDTGQSTVPAFTLQPAATVDEGNNWINMFYGPLSLSNPPKYTVAGTPLAPLGNYNATTAPGKGAPPYVPLP